MNVWDLKCLRGVFSDLVHAQLPTCFNSKTYSEMEIC
jgi:hypothetical protein